MRAYLHHRDIDDRYHQCRIKVEHVKQNVEELRANTAKAKERVAAVVEAQQEVALCGDELVVATRRVHVEPVARKVEDQEEDEADHVLRVQVGQHDQQPRRGAPIGHHVQHRAKRRACNCPAQTSKSPPKRQSISASGYIVRQ